MKSQHISIFSGNADGNSAAETPANPQGNQQGGLASYRARYQAFLNQQAQRQKPQRRRYETSILVRFTEGVINFAIFVLLFLAILTLFGYSLTWLNSNIKVVKQDGSAAGKQSNVSVADAVPSPSTFKRNSHHR